MKKPLLALFSLLIPLLLFNLAGVEQYAAKALITSTLLLWFFEWLPLPVTGLLIPLLATLYGVLPVDEAFSVFGNPILFLFLGSFLLARSMEKHQWDKRMIRFLLSTEFVSYSLNRVLIVFFLCAWILSFWISNTAACAVMVPLALGIGHTLKHQINDPGQYRNFMLRILLGTAFSATIGGVVTPIGSPPNLIAIHFLADKGLHLGFLGWLIRALPISLVMLFALMLLLRWRYPLRKIQLQSIRQQFQLDLQAMGPLKTAEIQVALVFSLAVLLWLLPGVIGIIAPQSPLLTWLQVHLPMNAVALIVATLLFILPHKKSDGSWSANLQQNDLKHISWETLLIFAGGLCLGKILNATGLATQMGNALFGISQNHVLLLSIAAVGMAIVLSELGSNTASASILIPILLGNEKLLSSFPPEKTILLIFLVAVGTSFGFMLPVSTPPNAIVYSSGEVPLYEMKKTGISFDLLGFAIIASTLSLLFW